MIGTKLGPYEILEKIGAGGMGDVYRARDSRLGREVAVKVLPAGLTTDPQRLHRFEQEARAAGMLNHPNILAIHDVGIHDGAPYVVSELLEGETLRARLDGSALPPRKAAEIAVQIAEGLAAAHEKGIINRDLKPGMESSRDGSAQAAPARRRQRGGGHRSHLRDAGRKVVHLWLQAGRGGPLPDSGIEVGAGRIRPRGVWF